MKKLFFILLLFPFVVFSQNQQAKIGLVLSGGGAKGFAHIGVLKAIEKAGLQIHYIAGTSMGAIVGGLYAAGYSANEIEKIITEVNFYELLQDINPRRSKPFFEKENGEKHTLVLPVEKGKIGLPQGVSKGQNVLSFLTHLLSTVDGIKDFKELPIPFFCIATNVENGKQVLLEKGSLPLALRASGAFPTLLNPIEIDNQLLIDGGIANNFPVSEMKKKGVDIIIGVDVQGKLIRKEKISSVLDVLSQITSYQMYNKTAAQKDKTDIYIHPDISEFTVLSFNKGEIILKKGEEEAFKFSKIFDSLSALQLPLKQKKRLRKRDEKFKINEIEIDGNKNYTRAYILGNLKLEVGDVISYKEISEKISYLSSTDNFDIIDYRLKTNGDGKTIVFKIKESPNRASIRLGLHYDFVYESSALINLKQKNVLIKNDIFSLDLVIGDRPRYKFDYFVDNGFYYSFGLSSSYNSFRTDVSSTSVGVNKVDLEYTDFTNSIYVQTTFDRRFAVGLSVEYKSILSETRTILTTNNSPFVYDDSDYLNALAYIKLDTYDDKYFPTKGVQIDAGFKWFLWSNDFNNDFVQFSQIKGKIGFAKTFLNNLTLEYISEGGFTFGEVASKTFDFVLGGYNQNFINNFVPFYGYDVNSLTEQTFLKSTINLRYKIAKNQYIQILGNFARVEDSVLKNGKLFDDTKSGYAIGYSVQSVLGPIELKYAWSPDTKNHFWYFNLGFWF